MANITFPTMDTDRDRITFFRTPFPKLGDAKIAKLAEAHGMRAKPEDAGSRIVIRDRRATLELFRASDSIRWSTLENGEAEFVPNGGGPTLPDDDAAVKLAGAFLRERGVSTKGAKVDSITQTTYARMTRRMKQPDERPLAVHVNYRYELEGLPVLGPGAKIQVTFVGGKKPAEMYAFWRSPRADTEIDLLPAGEAMELLRRDPQFEELGDDAHVDYTNPRLGYYALPPRETQGALIPVYAFDGIASTKELRRYEFTRYVVAVRYTPEEAKQVGAAFRGAGPIFS
jgi:hypothetical protein